MKQIGSVITGTAMAKRWSTGEQPGATGSGEQLPTSEQVPAVLTAVPRELTSTVPDSVRHWMALPADTMPWDLEHHGLEVLNEAAQAVAHAQAGVERALPLVSREKIADVIGSMAEMLQVTVPSTTGLKLYFHALKDLPTYKFEAAALKLIKTHKWPRLPLPADFIEAAKEERQDIEAFTMRLSITRQKLDAARRSLHQRSK